MVYSVVRFPFRRISLLALLLIIFAICAAPTTAPDSGEHSIATLPDGVTVELLGIVQDPTGSWWKPDGSPLDAPPTVALERNYAGDKPAFFVAVRFQHLPKEKEPTIFLACRGDFPIDDMPGEYHDLKVDDQTLAFTGVREPDQKLGWVKVGVCDEDWRTVCTVERSGFTDVALRLQAPPEDDVEYVGYEEHKGDLLITVKDSLKADLVSVMVVEQGGKERRLTWGGSESTLRTRIRHFQADGLKRQDVKQIRVESRSFRWINFKGIAVEQGATGDPEVEVLKREGEE